MGRDEGHDEERKGKERKGKERKGKERKDESDVGHLRGAPSAISIAVMPSDHRSLCRDTDRKLKTLTSSTR